MLLISKEDWVKSIMYSLIFIAAAVLYLVYIKKNNNSFIRILILSITFYTILFPYSLPYRFFHLWLWSLLLIVTVLFNFNKQKYLGKSFIFISFLFMMLFYIFSSTFFITNDYYTNTKILNFVMLIIIPCSICYLWGFNPKEDMKWLIILCLLGNLLTFCRYTLDLQLTVDDLKDLRRILIINNIDVVQANRNVGLGTILALYGLISYWKERKRILSLIFIPIFIMEFIILLYFQGRAALFLTLFCIFLIITYILLQRKNIFALFILFLSTLVVILLGRNMFEFGRYGQLLDDGDRIKLLKNTLETSYIKGDLFWGCGIGRFKSLIGGGAYYYPHNVVVELLAELGLGICFLFLLFIIYLIYLGITRQYKSFIMVLFVYYFINSMVASDIIGNNMLFLVIVIALSEFDIQNRTKKGDKKQNEDSLSCYESCTKI